MTLKPVVLRVPITELPTLVERKSKQTALNGKPEPMSLPINDLSYLEHRWGKKNRQITWLEVKRDLVRLPIPEPAAEVMVMQLLFWLLLLWRCELLDMTEEDSRPPLAPVIWWWKNSLNEEGLEVDIANSRKNSRCTIFLPVICLADIELLLAWLWALELLVPVIITACPSWAMAAEQKYLSSLFSNLFFTKQNRHSIQF